MCHSSSGQVFGLSFDSYAEIKHFAGFFLTKDQKKHIEFDVAYNKWRDTYFNDDEEFIGDVT